MKKITRRGFLKGSVAGTAGILATGMLSACSNSTETVSPEKVVEETSKTTWRTAPAAIPADQIAEEYEADVVVIGAGHSGVSCARAAAEGGAIVILAELQAEKNYYVFGSEYGGINSEYLMKNRGVQPVDRALCYTDWMNRNAWHCNSAFVKSYVNKSGATFDWLIEELEPEFVESFTTDGVPGPAYETGIQNGQYTWSGAIDMQDSSKVHKAGIAKMLSCNAENKMLWQCSLEQLVKENGRVVAAILTNADGKYIRLNAKTGVVVATGGFCANAEMCYDIYWNLVEKYPVSMQETVDVSYPMASRLGKGHQACVWAGAIWEPEVPASMSWQNPCGFNPFNNAKFALSNLWLDENGNRYVNEGGDFQIAGLQGQYLPVREDGTIRIYSIFDASLLEDLQYQQSGHASSCINDAEVGASLIEEIKTEMQATIDVGDEGYITPWLRLNQSPYPVYAADSVEQLADRLGMEDSVRKNFIASVERYNELCDKGTDEDFFKDAQLMLPIRETPLFGYMMDYKLTVGLTTLSGMWTDDTQCCLDGEHNRIEGLYATGNVCGRRWIDRYSTSVAGQSVALANTLGKELGEYLATEK